MSSANRPGRIRDERRRHLPTTRRLRCASGGYYRQRAHYPSSSRGSVGSACSPWLTETGRASAFLALPLCLHVGKRGVSALLQDQPDSFHERGNMDMILKFVTKNGAGCDRQSECVHKEHKQCFLSPNCYEMALRQRGCNRRPIRTTSARFQRVVASGRNSFF